jgi:hypothetical protein
MDEVTGSGENTLFRDSKLGLTVAGIGTVVIDSVIDGVINGMTNVDTSGWNGWWTTLASAALATALGAVTAYKAKRRKTRSTL